MEVAGKGLAAAGKAAQKGLEVVLAEGKKTVAALKEAHRAYNEHRKGKGSHLEDARQEEQKALAALETVNTANLS